MPEYMINGIPVNFPFEPYSVQSAYMEKVLECLKKVYHCVTCNVQPSVNPLMPSGNCMPPSLNMFKP
jgi:hypothetical protein